MKKIAFYIPDLKMGGGEIMMINLANQFAFLGYDVDFILNEHKGHYVGLLNKKIKIIELKSSRAIYAIPKMIRYLMSYNPDRMLSTLYHANLINILCCLFTFKRKRSFLIQENIIKEIVKSSSLKQYIHLFFVKILYRLSGGVIAVSHGVLSDLIDKKIIKPTHGITIHNPVISHRVFQLMTEPLDCPFFSDGYIYLINVGRFNIAKNHTLLIKAFKVLVDDGFEQLKLVLVGDGELRNDIENLVNELGLSSKVFFAGSQLNPFNWMYKSNIFVFSSNWEGFGNVLVEALACKCAVVSTNCPSGPAEILEDGKYGILVENNNIEALVEGTKRMLVQNIYSNADPLSYSRFTVDVVADKYIKYLNI